MIKTTIACFGDSLTLGYGVDVNVGYVDRLEKFLPLFYPDILWSILNMGINGDTAGGGLIRLERQVLSRNPNIVIILFGSNDSSYYSDENGELAAFEANLCAIIEKTKAYNNKTGLNNCRPIPMLATLPPVDDEAAGGYTSNAVLELYSGVIRRLAVKYNCPLIDLNAYMLNETNGSVSEILQEDGVHLSNKGYDLMYDCIFSAITRLITRDGILKDYND